MTHANKVLLGETSQQLIWGNRYITFGPTQSIQSSKNILMLIVIIKPHENTIMYSGIVTAEQRDVPFMDIIGLHLIIHQGTSLKHTKERIITASGTISITKTMATMNILSIHQLLYRRFMIFSFIYF